MKTWNGAALLAIIIFGSVFLINRDSDVEIEKLTKKISKEEISQMVGQMIMVGFRGVEVSDEIQKDIENFNIGGVILFDYDVSTKSYGRNILDSEQIRSLTESLQNISNIPMFIAIDAEGGQVNRLKPENGFLEIPSHKELGMLPLEDVQVHSESLANQLRGVGINVNFAPVIDVDINPDNPIIGLLGRSFSSDPDIVTKQASAYIDGHRKYGIITSPKHFPGHGSAAGDTHKGVVDVTNVYNQKELEPFRDLVSLGKVDALMSAHIINKNVDSIYPASLSRKHIEEILRNDIGFDGVVFSDDIDMGAIKNEFSLKESLVLAINAGVDIIVSSNNVTGYNPDRAGEIHRTIMKALNSGEIPVSRIIESNGRIVKLKESLK
jgi:beta-N-acetylhexosaminidase